MQVDSSETKTATAQFISGTPCILSSRCTVEINISTVRLFLSCFCVATFWRPQRNFVADNFKLVLVVVPEIGFYQATVFFTPKYHSWVTSELEKLGSGLFSAFGVAIDELSEETGSDVIIVRKVVLSALT